MDGNRLSQGHTQEKIGAARRLWAILFAYHLEIPSDASRHRVDEASKIIPLASTGHNCGATDVSRTHSNWRVSNPKVSSPQDAGASFATAPITEFRIKLQHSLPPLTGLGKLVNACGR